jgi:hypothetical protein
MSAARTAPLLAVASLLLTPALAAAGTGPTGTGSRGSDVKALVATPLDAAVFVNSVEWDFTNGCGTSNGLPTGGVSNNGPGFAINDVTTLAEGDAFDCGSMVWIGDTALADDDGTIDVSPSGGDTVVTPATRTIGGLEVTDSYRIFAAGDTVRVLVKLRNPSAAAISTPVSYVSNFGSDAATTLAGSSSGGPTFTTADRWIVTADDPVAGTDVINTSVFFGPGTVDATPTSVASSVFDSSGTDGALATFDVTVPAGATRYLMFFNVVTGGNNGTPNSSAVAAAAVWNTPIAAGSPLLAGISAEDAARIANWTTVVDPPPPPTTTTTPAAAPAAAVGVVPTFTG